MNTARSELPALKAEVHRLKAKVAEQSKKIEDLTHQLANHPADGGTPEGTPDRGGHPGYGGTTNGITPPETARESEAKGNEILKHAERGNLDAVKLHLSERPQDRDFKNRFGRTPLIEAARKGHLDVVRYLVYVGADCHAKNKDGQTAADVAFEKGQYMMYAVLDPQGAKTRAAQTQTEFSKASLVHLISTRFDKDPSQLKERLSCDPFKSAENLQKYLQATKGVRCFNPNVDHAFLLDGKTDIEGVRGRMLRNTLSDTCGLARVKATEGVVLQLLVPPGPSDYQIAEAQMAREKSVHVVVVDCRAIKHEASEADFEEMPEVRAVKARQPKSDLSDIWSRLKSSTKEILALGRPSAS